MATYLQGVTDYIPDYQPFQPDLNFYANVLQTKQNQYDTNYKAINNLYGQLYNSDLTHGDNVKKKSELLKQIDFNLKRVSGLDLSLEQNVEQATQVFKPFYQDQYLMKDMAWTKNFNNTYAAAEALQNNQDKNRREEYWPTGIKELQYRKEEFRNADLEKTLNIGNAQYTPYVNAAKLYGDLIDKADFNIETNLPDASGMYMVKQKNGQLVLPSLQKLLVSEYANNPALQKVYATRAYVERNDSAVQNADKFNGDKLAAEKDFLQQRYNYLSNYAAKRAKENKEAETAVVKKTNSVENDIQSGDVNPMQGSYLERLNAALKVESAARQHSDNVNGTVNGESRTAVTTGPSGESAGLDLSNMELARLKVDAATASLLAETDIMDVASGYATKGQVLNYSVNQIGLENLRHSHNIQRDAIKNEYSKENLKTKIIADRENERIKHYISTGYYTYDEDTGQPVINPMYAALGVEPSGSGSTTEDPVNIREINKEHINKVTHEIANPFMGTWFNDMTNLISNQAISEQELYSMMNGDAKNVPYAPSTDARDPYDASNVFSKALSKKSAIQQFGELKAAYDKDPVGTVNKLLNNKQLRNIYNGFTKWTNANNGHSISQKYNTSDAKFDMHKLMRAQTEFDSVEEENNNKIINGLSKVNILNPSFKGLSNDAMNYLSSIYSTGKTEEEFVKDAVAYDKIKNPVTFTIERKFDPERRTWTEVPVSSAGSGGKESYYSQLYKALQMEYTKIVTDANPETGLKSVIPTTAIKSGQAGLAANTGFKMVNPAIPTTIKTLTGLYDDINKINWNQGDDDINPYKISIGGITKTGVEDEDNLLDAEVAKSIIAELVGEIKPSSKIGPFKVSQNQIALENKNIGAMTVHPPIEFLKKNVLGDDSKPDMAKINKILKNGIAFIAPKDNWNNDLFKQNLIGITESVLNSKGEIKFESANNAGKYTIKKETNVPGVDYNITYSLYGMDANGNKIIKNEIPMQLTRGNRIEDAEEYVYNLINVMAMKNLQKYQEFHRQGNYEAMKNAETNFGISKSNINWNY